MKTPIIEARRPKRIDVRWYDPWTGIIVCSASLVYDPVKAAKGIYSRYIQRVSRDAKHFASHILQDRTARSFTTLIR